MASVGPHYDPLDRLNNQTEQDYDTLCTPLTPEMCELGDLTGKFEQLTIEGKFFLEWLLVAYRVREVV